jgi:hypothetical protein
MLMRCLIYNFLKTNHNLELAGLRIITALSAEYATVNEYCEYEVIVNYTDAKGLILNLLPIVLRHPIQVVVADLNDDNVN